MTDFNRTESIGSGVAPGAAVASEVRREAEAWTIAQRELLSGMGALWTDWLRRQQEAIDASARSVQQMFECRNPADLAQIQQEWLAGTAKRSVSDITALACDSMALGWRVVGADRLGARETSPPARGTERAKSGNEAPLQRAAAE